MTNNPCFVLDTNVLISAALVFQGKPNQVLSYVLTHGTLLFSEKTFEEIETRIHRPKFHRYLKGKKAEDYVLHKGISILSPAEFLAQLEK